MWQSRSADGAAASRIPGDRARECRAERLRRRHPTLGRRLVRGPGSPRGACLQSLLTGNYEMAARIKVSSAGLECYLDLDVGAFGSDNRDWLCLVPVAIEKVRR